MKETIRLVPSDRAEQLNFDWGGLTWYASGSLGNSEEVTVGRCRLNPGSSNPRHYHPNCSEILVVLQGHIRHTVADGTESEMQPGDTVTVLPNVWHRATTLVIGGPSIHCLYLCRSPDDRRIIREVPDGVVHFIGKP